MAAEKYDGLISVIIPTYNWPQALALVLQSLNHQIDQNFEVLVVDDGSTDDTRAIIEQFKPQLSFSLTYLWQEDKGFRAGRARNMGIAKAKGDYVVFVDGDCVMRSSFVANHRILAHTSYFVVGNRVLLSPSFSHYILDQQQDVSVRGVWYWALKRLRGHLNRWHSLLRLPLGPFRFRHQHRWQKAKSCNLAVWREDLIKIGGFEEQVTGWGYEDSDLVIRLLNSGVLRKSGRFATTILHLWHPEADRQMAQTNFDRLKILEKQKVTQASKTILASSMQKDASRQ